MKKNGVWSRVSLASGRRKPSSGHLPVAGGFRAVSVNPESREWWDWCKGAWSTRRGSHALFSERKGGGFGPRTAVDPETSYQNNVPGAAIAVLGTRFFQRWRPGNCSAGRR